MAREALTFALLGRTLSGRAWKKNNLHIALVGNPNSGKSSLFNALTGLNQKVGNFPGVTVDKKSGSTTPRPGLQGQYHRSPRHL